MHPNWPIIKVGQVWHYEGLSPEWTGYYTVTETNERHGTVKLRTAYGLEYGDHIMGLLNSESWKLVTPVEVEKENNPWRF